MIHACAHIIYGAVSTYVYVSVHICMYVCTYLHTYVCICVDVVYTCMCIYIYIYMYIYEYVSISMCILIFIYTDTHTYIHTEYTCIHIYIYMYIYIYIYIYMSVCVCVKWEWWVDIDGMSLHKTKLIQVEFLLRRDMWNRGSNMKVLVRKGKFMQDYLCNFKMTVVWGGHAEYGICAGTFRNVFAWKHDPAQYIALHL